MLKNKKFLIGGIIVFMAIGFLSFNAFKSGVTYYFEVSELLKQGNSVYGDTVRVRGLVAPGSIEQQVQGATLKFTIIDDKNGDKLMVVYQGVVPDTFKENSEVVCEGRLDSGGIFRAQTLMPKCPSKYVPS